MELLLSDKRVNVNQSDKEGHTALIIAAIHGHTKVVEQLLMDQRVEVNQSHGSGCCALIWAAAAGHASVVQLFLNDKRVNVNITSNLGYTALMIAAEMGNQTVVKLLLGDTRVNVNITSKLGFTALTIAAKLQNQTVVELLLSDKRVNEWMNANIKPAATLKSHTAVEEAVLSPEDVGVAQVDGAVVTKKESSCWNCNTPDHALELMKCKRCKRVRFFLLLILSPFFLLKTWHIAI